MVLTRPENKLTKMVDSLDSNPCKSWPTEVPTDKEKMLGKQFLPQFKLN